MRTRLILLSAGITISAISFPVCAQNTPAMNEPPSTQPSGMMSDGTNGDRAMAPDAKNICGTLADATEAAVKKNGFDNLVKRFVDADRTRISKNDLTKADWDKLNDRVEAIQRDWKAKYNQDFDISKPMMVFNDNFRIVQGVIGEAQPAAGHMQGDQADQSKRDPGLPDTTPGAESNKIAGGDVNREPGRKVAEVTFPASHGLPTLYIPMIREFPDAWKIDVPDQVDGRKLYDNLIDQLTMLDQHKDQWPEDVNDAYRAVSHHVLMAVLNISKMDDTMQPMTPGSK